MTQPALTIIRQEHAALSAMLRSLTLLLGEHRRRNSLPDFGVLRAMLFYVDEFPEKLHHAKESECLFPKLRERSRDARDVLERLDHEHVRGGRAIRDLAHELLGFEVMCETAQMPARRERFEQALQRYVDFYLEHMRVEESVVLPLAEQVLSAADWAEVNAAFAAHRDPLAGQPPDDAYLPLFVKIVNALPAPLGLGSALQALAASGSARLAAER